jgi:hypothetical protein
MSNLRDPLGLTADGLRAMRVADRAGAEHLGASVYRLQPGEEMVFPTTFSVRSRAASAALMATATTATRQCRC